MRETNVEFSKRRIFAKACELAHVDPTTRQASKYRRGRGMAIKFRVKASWLHSQEAIKSIFKKKGEANAY